MGGEIKSFLKGGGGNKYIFLDQNIDLWRHDRVGGVGEGGTPIGGPATANQLTGGVEGAETKASAVRLSFE
jgi:hypothetical protein